MAAENAKGAKTAIGIYYPGIYGDRMVKITVYNGPPDGGASNNFSLRVFAKWLAEDKEARQVIFSD